MEILPRASETIDPSLGYVVADPGSLGGNDACRTCPLTVAQTSLRKWSKGLSFLASVDRLARYCNRKAVRLSVRLSHS